MEDLLIGFINSLTSIIITILYIPCLKIIATDTELSASPCFKLMLHLGISDLICSTLHFIFAILLMTGYIYVMPFWLNKFLGAIIDGLTWISSTTFLHVIAFNRWTIATNSIFGQRVFSKFGTKMLISLIWLYSAIWMIFLMTPWVSFVYYPSIWSAYFDSNSTWYDEIKQADWIHNQLMLWPSAFWYFLTILRFRKERKQIVNQQNSLPTREWSVFGQAALIFLYCMLGSQYWHAAPSLQQWGFKYAYALGNWLWLTNSAINPIVYLTMNSTIKLKIKEMLGLKSTPPAIQQQKRNKRKVANDAVILETL